MSEATGTAVKPRGAAWTGATEAAEDAAAGESILPTEIGAGAEGTPGAELAGESLRHTGARLAPYWGQAAKRWPIARHRKHRGRDLHWAAR